MAVKLRSMEKKRRILWYADRREMLAKLAVENLRQRISSLEERQRRFSRTISVADAVDRWLPHGGLSAGCIHEVKGISLANAVAFSAILSSQLTGNRGNVLYIAADRSLHPLGLLPYGLNLDRILHVSTRRSPDLVWAVMEALRCPQVPAPCDPALMSGLSDPDRNPAVYNLQRKPARSNRIFFGPRRLHAPIASPVTRWRVSAVIDKSDRRFDEPCMGARSSLLPRWTSGKLDPGMARSKAERPIGSTGKTGRTRGPGGMRWRVVFSVSIARTLQAIV